MSLIHWLKLDEASGGGAYLLDSVGTAHGTPTGTTSVPGLFDRARAFAANTDRISCAVASDLNFGTLPFTWAAWVKFPSSASTLYRMLGGMQNGGQYSFLSYVHPSTSGFPNQLQMSLYGTPASLALKTPFTMIDGGLHHVVLTRDGANAVLYIDAAVAASSSACPTTLNDVTGVSFNIGNVSDSNQGFIDGWIDNVQFWNTALTASEVNDLYYKSASSLNIANQVPPASATDVARDTNIQASLVATGSNIVLTSVRLWVKGTLAYDGSTDTFQHPYDGPSSARTGTPAQYNFTVDPDVDFPYDDTVSVRLYGQDDAANTVDQTWSFDVTKDVTAPALDNRNPAPSAINVRWNTNVYLEIYETETLVDRSTIKVYVQGTLAFSAGAFQPGFTGTVLPADATASRYYVTVNPDTNFPFSTPISVRVVARNTSTPYEELDTTYSFTTEASSLSLTDRDPAPSETGVSTTKSPVVALQDTTYNIVPGTVNIYVDGHLAYDGTAFQPGYNGPGSQRTGTPAKYTYTIDPTTNFAFAHTVSIRVVGQNDDGQPLDQTYSFTTKDAVYVDKGTGGRVFHVDTTVAMPVAGVGLVYLRDPTTPYIGSLQPPSGQIAIEARLIPALNTSLAYLLSGAEMSLGYNHRGLSFWTYVAKGQTNTFVHERLVGLRPSVDNYLALRHVFGDRTSTALIANGTQVVGRWYGTFPAQVAGTGAIMAFANVGGGVVRVTSNGHGMATGTWVRIYGTTNYNDVFQIANALTNTFDITATWAGDDGAGTWDKTNNDHNLAGWTKPAFAVHDYDVALGRDDVLVMFGMNSVAKTVANLIAYAKGRL